MVISRIKMLILLILLIFLAVSASACTDKLYYCDHCKQWADTHNRLVSGIDMELCDECYTTYLDGKWDINRSKRK